MHPRLLADRYELISVLASGGMGRVWRARDMLLNRLVAVKVLREDVAGGDPSSRARLRAEAQHAAALTSLHIAALFDYGETPPGPGGTPLPFLVMELVEGESLADVLRREGRLDVPRTLDLVRQTADGLATAHAAGVVHRDVKPANLLVRPDGTVKITDFGIARSATSASVTVTGQVMGTAHYLSPEVASGERSTPASDVYALGLVAHECLTGRRAFEGDNPVQVAVRQIREEVPPLPAGIPAPVRALVERATAKDPAARFPDGAALRAAVDRVRSGAPPEPAGTTPTAVLPPLALHAEPATPAARRWLLPALIAVAVLAVGVTVLVAALSGRSAPTGADAAPTSSTPAAVEVVADDLVGRPVGEVQAALAGRGLQVELVAMETTDVPDGQVMAVDPTGALSPGDTVRVSYAVAPAPSTTTPPVVTTAPAPAPTTAEPPAPGKPGKPDRPGHGGGGHGHGHD